MKKITSFFIAVLLTITLAACGDATAPSTGNDIYPDEEGHAIGAINDIMHTYFFDFTVNSAYLCDSYASYEAAEGYELLIAEVTVKNTFKDTITMCDIDFQAQWNDDAEDAFNVPITYYMDITEVISEEIFPYEYELKKNKSRTGLMVFEVPAGKTDFSISYLEYFDDYTTGDLHFVYFTATEKQSEE